MRELGARIALEGRPEPINSVGRFFNVGQYSFWCRWLIPESAVRSEPEIYVCPAAWPTIGYGHVVRKDEQERFADGIDEATAAKLLRRDVEAAVRAVLRLILVPLEDGQFDALGSFAFNLGAGALQRSTLRRKVNREEHGAVPTEFRRWVYAGGQRLRGLERRRAAEAMLWHRGAPSRGFCLTTGSTPFST